jgi:hypothetical protein
LETVQINRSTRPVPLVPGKTAHLPLPLVRGAAARPIASAQGHTFAAIAAGLDTRDHQATGAALDAEGDRLRDRLADVLTVACALAKRERAYKTHNRLIEALALARRISELDDAEDYHLIAEASAGVDRALGSSRRTVLVLEEILCGAKGDDDGDR